MPSVNRRWSEERLGQEDYPVNFAGFSPFQRWGAPYVAKPGDSAFSRRGVKWFFGRCKTAIPAPVSTAATINFTTVDGEITAIGAVATGGAGYRVGEQVPVLGGFGGRIKVTGVDAAGAITTAVLLQHYIAPNQLGPAAKGAAYPASGIFTLEAPAAPFSLVAPTNLYEGEMEPGAGYKSYAPTDPGEFGWFEAV